MINSGIKNIISEGRDANSIECAVREHANQSKRDGNEDYLSIGIGGFTHFYTLRRNYLEKKYVPSGGSYGNAVVNGEYQGRVEWKWKSYHLQNLSQDYDEAISKAESIAADHLLELRVSVDNMELDEIRRRDAEEILRQKHLRWERNDARVFSYEDPRGLVLFFGKYRGENVYDVFKKDRDYLEFVNKNVERPTTMHYRIQTILEHAPRRRKQVSHHVGEVKERLTLKVTLVFARHIETHFGSSELLKFKDSKGNIFTTFYSGARFDCDLNDTITIKGTVKKHDVFRDDEQTVINRIKLITNHTQKGNK